MLLLIGCYDSRSAHDSDVPEMPDASAPDFARRVDAAGPDAAFLDTRPADAAPSENLIFPVPVGTVVGTRWDDETTLAVAFERRAEMPIELWNVREVHPNIRDGALVLDGTEASRVAAASRWGNLVAVAVDKVEGPHEVIVADVAERRIVTRIVPDPSLMRDRVFHVYVALAQRELLVIWYDPESVHRYRVISFDGSVRDLSFGLAGTNSLSAAVRLSADDEYVNSILQRRLGPAALDTVEERLERSWVSDGSSVAAFDRGALHIDHQRVEEPRPVRTLYGRISYARRSNERVVAMTTGNGLLAATIGPFFAVEWHELESRFPAGAATAHVYDRSRGLFVVEGAIGFQPARLRWIAL